MHAGLDKANPSAMFLTFSLMLEHLGFCEAARSISQAVVKITASKMRTYDLDGQYGTKAVADAIIQTAKTIFESQYSYGVTK
jgi:3-isopropylmalate dehydrogenase